jgi:hypothetical protein
MGSCTASQLANHCPAPTKSGESTSSVKSRMTGRV